jgi:hypothetical protein
MSKPKSKLKAKAKAIVSALRKQPMTKPKPIRLTIEEMALKLVRQQIKIDRDKEYIKGREIYLDGGEKNLRNEREKFNRETVNLVIYELLARDVHHSVRRWEKSTATDRDAVLTKEMVSYGKDWAARIPANEKRGE